jgi:hypothetical protein
VHIDGLGETEFKISSSEITAAIKSGLEEAIEAEPEVSTWNLACFVLFTFFLVFI